MNTFTMNSLQNLLGFPFREARWKEKGLIAFLLMLAGWVVPLVPHMFLLGYAAQIARRIVVEKGEPYLPEWDNWSQLLLDGLRLLGVTLLFLLPVLALFFASYAGMMLPAFAAAWVEETGETPDTLLMLVMLAGILLFVGLLGLGLLLAVAVGVVLPVALTHVIVKQSFAAAFRFGEWWPIFRANLSGFLLAYLLAFGLSMVAGLAAQVLYLTLIFCCLMPFVFSLTSIYLMLISYALYAMAYRDGAEKLVALVTRDS